MTTKKVAASYSPEVRERAVRLVLEGGQYTPLAFGRRCSEAGVRPSMGSVGDAYDCEFTVPGTGMAVNLRYRRLD